MNLISGLQLMLRLNETGQIIDYSPNNFPVTFVGAGSRQTVSMPNSYQSAINLTGGQYMYVPDNSLLDLSGQMAFSFFLRPSGTGAYTLFGKPNAAFNAGFDSSLNANRTLNLALRPVGANYNTLGTIPANEWTHVVFQANRVNGTGYITGYLTGILDLFTATSAWSPVDSTGNFNIGTRWPANTSLSGAIYDFRVYNRNLTSEEISALANHSYYSRTENITVQNKTAGQVYNFGSTGTNITRIIGGADSGLFSLSNGVLSFNYQANYLNPQDANGDNVYEVVVTKSNNDGTYDYTIRVTPYQPSVVSNNAKVRYGNTISPSVITGLTLGTGIVGTYNDRFDDVGYY